MPVVVHGKRYDAILEGDVPEQLHVMVHGKRCDAILEEALPEPDS